MSKTERPRVSVSLFVVKGSSFLLGRKKGGESDGYWAPPAGHQERGETPEETAVRELNEEAGPDLIVTAPRFHCLSNLTQRIPDGGRHYVDVGMISHWLVGKPELAEPDKFAEWRWFSIWGEPPIPSTNVVANLLEAYRTGRPYFA